MICCASSRCMLSRPVTSCVGETGAGRTPGGADHIITFINTFSCDIFVGGGPNFSKGHSDLAILLLLVTRLDLPDAHLSFLSLKPFLLRYPSNSCHCSCVCVDRQTSYRKAMLGIIRDLVHDGVKMTVLSLFPTILHNTCTYMTCIH